jgi:hypothetical protein
LEALKDFSYFARLAFFFLSFFLSFSWSSIYIFTQEQCARFVQGAVMVGPRLGRFSNDNRVCDMKGHNSLMSAFGVIILWYCWFSFNAGSALLHLNTSHPIASLVVNFDDILAASIHTCF